MINTLVKSQCKVHATAPTNFAVIEIAKRFRNLFAEQKFFIVGTLSRLRICDDLLEFHLETKKTKIENSVRELRKASSELCRLFSMDIETNPLVVDDLRGTLRHLESSTQILKSESLQGLFSESVDLDIRPILKELIGISQTEFLDWFRHLRQPRSLLGETRPAMVTITKSYTELIRYVRGIVINNDIFNNLESFLLSQVDVYFSTVNVGGRGIFSLVPVDVVIIDEASQLLPGDIATMFRSKLRCLVLVGDEKQLPAVVQSPQCQLLRYDVSLFDRLIKMKYPSTMLNVQYRMHPLISSWPSQQFYHGQIQNCECVLSNSYNKPWHEQIQPLVLFDIRQGEEDHDGSSLYHEMQAHLVRKIVASVIKITSREKGSSISIGVISPYKQQVSLLSDLGSNKETSRFPIKVCTIDGYQGQEADIIIFTTVRSNSDRNIGFVRDWRRLNVAITRSKYSMIVVGDVETLSSNPYWANYLNYIKANGQTYQLDARAVSRLLPGCKDSTQFFQPSVESQKVLWSVIYSKSFENNLKKTDPAVQKQVTKKIFDFSCGTWPHEQGRRSSEKYGEIIRVHRVNNSFSLIWTVDVDQKKSIQCLKIWSVVEFNGVPNAIREIENMFGQYSEHYLNCCKKKPSSNFMNKYEPNEFEFEEGIRWFRSGKH
jgi:mRNA-degrading endonuclease RelE of RelBE toxin-antitoxin system